jgi:hypothetical protein
MRAILRDEYSGRKRFAARLQTKLDKTLVAYANAATAAGVGILALSCPAGAKIIYTHVHQQIPLNKTFSLDLNHDGIADFAFSNTKGTTSFGGGWAFLTIFPTKSANRIWGDKTGDNGFFRYASALAAGAQVGPNQQLSPGNKLMAQSSSNPGHRRQPSQSCEGLWGNQTNRYLGLKFMIKGKAHYGWARLTVSCSNTTVTATLTGYAYETIPNKPIIAGKTKGPDDDSNVEQPQAAVFASPAPELATLALLAQGASGLEAWRRKETQEAPVSGK